MDLAGQRQPPARLDHIRAIERRGLAKHAGQVVLGQFPFVGRGGQDRLRRRLQVGLGSAFAQVSRGRGAPDGLGVQGRVRGGGPRVQAVHPGRGPGQVRREQHDDRDDRHDHPHGHAC
jgi:hypothetical protein